MPLPITPNLTWCQRCPRSPKVLHMLWCQAGTAPCPLQSQGSSPAQGMSPGPSHPQGSLHGALFQLFSAAVSKSPPVSPSRPRQEPALPSSHKPYPNWHFGVALCFFLQETPNQTKPHQTPFLHLAGALGTRRGKEEVRVQPWAADAEIGHRAGLVGPVGPAEPCPGHSDTPCSPLSLSLPLPR